MVSKYIRLKFDNRPTRKYIKNQYFCNNCNSRELKFRLWESLILISLFHFPDCRSFKRNFNHVLSLDDEISVTWCKEEEQQHIQNHQSGKKEKLHRLTHHSVSTCNKYDDNISKCNGQQPTRWHDSSHTGRSLSEAKDVTCHTQHHFCYGHDKKLWYQPEHTDRIGLSHLNHHKQLQTNS